MAEIPRRALAALFLASVALASGCHSAPDPIAFDNRVFYHYDDPNADLGAFEKRYPPLDFAEKTPLPEYIGVSVLGSNIKLSRPKNWVVTYASNKAQERFIEYVSPDEYVFSIYERVDAPSDPWREVMGRYEDEVKGSGGNILGSRVPVSTYKNDGRAYVVQRPVKAAKAPFVGMAREYLVRSDHRVVLVQVIHQTDTIKPATYELYRVMQTMMVD